MKNLKMIRNIEEVKFEGYRNGVFTLEIYTREGAVYEVKSKVVQVKTLQESDKNNMW